MSDDNSSSSSPFEDYREAIQPPPENVEIGLSKEKVKRGLEEGWIEEVDGEYHIRVEKLPESTVDAYIEDVVDDE